MADKNIKVNVEFISKGLNKVKEGVNESLGMISSDKSKKDIDKILQRVQALDNLLNEQGNKVSSNSLGSFEKEYKEILKAYTGIRSLIIEPIDKTKAKQINEINEKTSQLSKEINDLKSENNASKRNLKGEGGMSKKFSQDVFKKTVTEGDLQSYTKTGIRTTVESSANETSKNINERLATQANLEKAVNQYLSDRTALKDSEKGQFQEILNDLGTNLTVEQALEHLTTDKIVAKEKLKVIEEETSKQAKLSQKIAETEVELEKEFTKEKELQKNLESEITPDNKGNKAIELSSKILKTKIELENELKTKIEEVTEVEKEQIPVTKKSSEAVEKQSSSFVKAAKNVISYAAVYGTLRKVYRETIKTVTELDKSMTQMAMVTGMSRTETWGLVSNMQELAKSTGFATTEIAQITTEYLKQGKTIQDAMILTEVAAKAARIGAISASDSVQYLTAAVNGFNLAAEDAIVVSDKFAALAASSATDYEELAVGLSKFAAQANIAGLSMDYALGLLAKGLETTREAPESIGTALKTVLARMRELTDLGKTMEDGMDVNRVAKSLRQVGVELMDSKGMFRSMEDVLDDVGRRWDTLNSNQQASVAVSLAGTRQQSRLLAMFQDYDRTLELVAESQDAAGATASQHYDYMQSMEAALTSLKTSWQNFITAISETEFIIDIVRFLARAVESLTKTFEALGETGKVLLISLVAMAGIYKTISILKTINIALTKAETGSLVLYLKDAWKMLTTMITESISRRKKAKDQAANIALVITEDVVDKAHNLTLMAKIKLLIAQAIAMAPVLILILAIIAAIAILVVVGMVLVNLFKKQEKSVKDLTASYDKQIFGIQKLIKEYDNLIKKIEELNNKPIKTQEDIEELARYADELEAIELKSIKNMDKVKDGGLGRDYSFAIDRRSDGSIIWETTIKALEEYREKEKEEEIRLIRKEQALIIEKKVKPIFKSGLEWQHKTHDETWKAISMQDAVTIDEVFRKNEKHDITGDIRKLANKNEKDLETTFDQTVRDKDARKIFIKNFALDYQGTLNEETTPMFDEFFEHMFDTADEFEMLSIVMGDTEESLLRSANDPSKIEKMLIAAEKYIETIQKTNERINLADTVNSSYKIYNEELNELDDKINNLKEYLGPNAFAEDFKAEIGLEIQGLEYVKKELISKNGVLNMIRDIFGDVENAELEIFKTMTPKTLNSLNESLLKAGKTKKEVEEIFIKAEKKYNNLKKDNMDSNIAYYTTWADIAMNIEDAAAQTEMFELALAGQNNELADAADHLKSIEENIKKTQKAYLDGTLSSGELFAFMEGHSNIFSDEKLFKRFMEGKDLSAALIEQKTQQYADYLQNLSTFTANIMALEAKGEALTKDQIGKLESLRAQKNQIIALATYRGELSTTNRVQYEYNKNLEVYNNFKKIGIDNLEIEQSMLESMANNMKNILRKTDEEINEVQQQIFNAFGAEAGTYYEISNGMVRLTATGLEQLSILGDSSFEIMDIFLHNVQNQLDIKLQTVLDYRDQELKAEEEKVAKLKKIYEGYFKDLDRLEEKRDRKQSREDIIKQLQRLEGATDEASKKKAKDLKADLIKMESDGAKKDRDESRKLLLESINTDKFKADWNEIILNLVQGGSDAAEAFIAKMEENGVINPSNVNGNKEEEEGEYSTIVAPLERIEVILKERFGSEPIKQTYDYKMMSEEFWEKFEGDTITRGGIKFLWDLPGFAKGGLVNQTGPAMLHGSKSGPEAVLSARQTEMFLGLRDALSNMSSEVKNNSNSSSNLTIENITINTKSMDSKQDFNSAGQELAKAFSNAINKNGLTLNTKR